MDLSLNYSILSINNANTAVASITLQQAYIDYVFMLTVSDGCNIVTRTITIHTMCDTSVTLFAPSVYSSYLGQMPVPYMQLDYDYASTQEAATSIAQCQKFAWTLTGFSEDTNEYPAPQPLSGGGSTPFVETAGFKAMISIICIVVAIAILLIILYARGCICNKSKGGEQ
jgi:hypothetical protein